MDTPSSVRAPHFSCYCEARQCRSNLFPLCRCEERDSSLKLRNRLRNLSPSVFARLTLVSRSNLVGLLEIEIATPRQVGARNDKKGKVLTMTKKGAQNDKEGICCASLALDRSGPRGCLKSALVGKGLVPSQFAGAHKGLQYRNFRHMDRLLINVLQVFLHID